MRKRFKILAVPSVKQLSITITSEAGKDWLNTESSANFKKETVICWNDAETSHESTKCTQSIYFKWEVFIDIVEKR